MAAVARPTHQKHNQTAEGGAMNRRSEALAARVEEGAACLEKFARELSEFEWEMPISPTDGRSVGVVIHHVASVYPIEIQLAQAIASGKAVKDVTWDVVANMNAGHAREHGGVTKAETLQLLHKNSADAARVVRTFTDDDLDRAAPFGLSFDAPVTAQFVIEDHALRHSWHHLARIKKALAR
jgi:hypothetical protein